MSSEVCGCCRGYYNPEHYSSCFECFVDRRSEFVACLDCGRWHSPQFALCFECRAQPNRAAREEAARTMRIYILHRDEYACVDCGRTSRDEPLQIDHIKPCAAGGTAAPWNLQVLCQTCNRYKGSGWPIRRFVERRRQLVAYYFLAGRSWLTPEQLDALNDEIEAIRAFA